MIKGLLKTAIMAGILLSAQSAQAAIYNFSQTGFEGGASITGSFTGTDLNNDGFINGSIFSNMNEITAFSVSYSGSATVLAFSQTLADLEYFSWKTSTSKIGDDQFSGKSEGIATNWFGQTGAQYLAGIGVNSMIASYVGYPDTQTYIGVDELHLINVTPAAVPVPGAVWLFGSALAGFSSLKRRQA
jgi:hypothetical protein